jgi:hypothetical protein
MTPIRELGYAPPTAPTQTVAHAPSPRAVSADDAPSPFARMVHGFAREADRGEATVRGVLDPRRGGAALDATHLLALQAGIYRYGETMDLAARLVDRASSGVKTVIQGQ